VPLTAQSGSAHAGGKQRSDFDVGRPIIVIPAGRVFRTHSFIGGLFHHPVRGKLGEKDLLEESRVPSQMRTQAFVPRRALIFERFARRLAWRIATVGLAVVGLNHDFMGVNVNALQVGYLQSRSPLWNTLGGPTPMH